MIGKILHYLANWFTSEWRYRIRFETKYNQWVVETSEKDAFDQWYAVCQLVTEGMAAGEHVPIKHASYQAARAYVEEHGFQYAYREQRNIKKPLPANLTHPDGPDDAGAMLPRTSSVRALGASPSRTY